MPILRNGLVSTGCVPYDGQMRMTGRWWAAPARDHAGGPG
jgi:hypothetical protein